MMKFTNNNISKIIYKKGKSFWFLDEKKKKRIGYFNITGF
jgi:hypothetical protein